MSSVTVFFDNLVSNSVICTTSQFPSLQIPPVSPPQSRSYLKVLVLKTHLYFFVSAFIFLIFWFTFCRCTVFTAQNECDFFLIKEIYIKWRTPSALVFGGGGWPSIIFPSSKLPEQLDRSTFIPELHCNVAKDQMAKNKSLERTLVKPSRCENVLKVRIGFCCGATLKPTFIPLFPKYRPSLQLRKQQPLKITKVHFTSVLILRFSGRRIIMEENKRWRWVMRL